MRRVRGRGARRSTRMRMSTARTPCVSTFTGFMSSSWISGQTSSMTDTRRSVSMSAPASTAPLPR